MNERLKKLMGLLNTPMNQGGGLLGNIPQGALLGAAMYGQGIKGKDPLAGLFPAYMQTAALQKMMTPKKGTLKHAYDPNKINADGSKGGVIFADDITIREKGLTPALPTEQILSMPGGGLNITKTYVKLNKIVNKKNIEQANNLYNSTYEINNVANTMINNLSKSKVGPVGGTISALDSVASQLSQAAKSFGILENYEDTGSGAIDEVITKNFKLDKEAINYEKVKSNAINLAYMMARVDEPGGRFTDRDIALKMEEIGVGANPQKTIEVLKGAVELRNKNAKFKYKTLTGQDMPSFEIIEEQKKKKGTNYDPLGIL